MSVRILRGDMRERLRELDDSSIDSVVTDPPYHLTSISKRFGKTGGADRKLPKKHHQFHRLSKGFMGQTWDGGDVAFQPETWAEVLRVLKPGAHLLAFSGTRTYHRMVCAIEDAGFEVGPGAEIRDMIANWIASDTFAGRFLASLSEEQKRALLLAHDESEFVGMLGWLYASGFPKSRNQPGGWGTALKPALEPIVLARKPLIGTVAANIAAHGTGALNIDSCRIDPAEGDYDHPGSWNADNCGFSNTNQKPPNPLGRWPANVIHDGSAEVVAGLPLSDARDGRTKGADLGFHSGGSAIDRRPAAIRCDSGSAARFFYSAKADSEERHMGCADLDKRNSHPTVKPIDLMRYLCRLITPAGGTVLDPFCGSGSTLIAADMEQFIAIGCELSDAYADIAERRFRASAGLFAEVAA